MIGLLPVKVSMTTKEQMTLSRSGERVKTSGIFTGGYGRFREFGGCCTQAVTGSSGTNGLISKNLTRLHRTITAWRSKTKQNACMISAFHSFERHWKQVLRCLVTHIMSYHTKDFLTLAPVYLIFPHDVWVAPSKILSKWQRKYKMIQRNVF